MPERVAVPELRFLEPSPDHEVWRPTVELVRAAYVELLGREPSADEIVTWLGAAARGQSLAEIFRTIGASDEAAQRWWERPIHQALADAIRLADGTVGASRVRLYFMHIPKTAGSSLRRAFAKQFQGRAAHTAWNIDQLADVPGSVVRGHAYVTGHFGREIYPIIGEATATFTVIREPVARARSHYQHICRDVRHYAHEMVRGWSFSQFIGEPRLRPLWVNYQARHVAANFGLLDESASHGDLLERARELFPLSNNAVGLARQVIHDLEEPPQPLTAGGAKRALDEISWVMATEHLDSRFDSLAAAAGWSGVGRLARANAHVSIDVDPGVAREVRLANDLDCVLHASALGRSAMYAVAPGSQFADVETEYWDQTEVAT